jgi:hypothetical protein
MCPVVRRPSGGGAILHDRELTYSVALPATHALARNPDALYCVVHHAIVDILRPLLNEAAARWSLKIRDRGEFRPPSEEPFLCFQRTARGDGVLTDTRQPGTNVKILGSAQRRLRGAILQHGSLLLETSPAAPELPGLSNLISLSMAFARLAGQLGPRIAGALEMDHYGRSRQPTLENRLAAGKSPRIDGKPRENDESSSLGRYQAFGRRAPRDIAHHNTREPILPPPERGGMLVSGKIYNTLNFWERIS